MNDYNLNLFVDYAEMSCRRLKPEGIYFSLLAGSGLSEKDIKRAVKVLDKRGIKVTYSNYQKEKFVSLHLQ